MTIPYWLISKPSLTAKNRKPSKHWGFFCSAFFIKKSIDLFVSELILRNIKVQTGSINYQRKFPHTEKFYIEVEKCFLNFGDIHFIGSSQLFSSFLCHIAKISVETCVAETWHNVDLFLALFTPSFPLGTTLCNSKTIRE